VKVKGVVIVLSSGTASCPGRGAARSDATQTRDPGFF
jgi:hypothetical protein